MTIEKNTNLEPTREDIENHAKAMYISSVFVAPKWEQLGDVTKSVWHERALVALKMAKLTPMNDTKE